MSTSVSKKILIWGAAKSTVVSLFDGGPNAYDVRVSIKKYIDNKPYHEAVFSENWKDSDGSPYIFGHHYNNAAFYEYKHVEKCDGLIMILPDNAPMAVNTWEISLAIEALVEHLATRVVIMMPEPHYILLQKIFRSKADDVESYPERSKGYEEPEIGAAGSFAIRKLHRYYQWERIHFPIGRGLSRGTKARILPYPIDAAFWTEKDADRMQDYFEDVFDWVSRW